jgi:hypothetical protein
MHLQLKRAIKQGLKLKVMYIKTFKLLLKSKI